MNDTDDNYERIIARLTNAPMIYVPARAHLDPRMTPALMRVFTSMCWHLNGDWECWPGLDLLASELGVTKQAVSKNIQQLIALGYVEIARRGFRGTGQTNTYRVIVQRNAGNSTEIQRDNSRNSDNSRDNSRKSRTPSGQKNSHSQPHVDSIVNLTLTHSQPHVDQKNTREEYQGRSSSEDSLLPTSLAQRADRTPPTVTAPPERRTRGRFDQAALRRDPLFIALCAYLPEPVLDPEWKQWGAMITWLHRGGVRAADIATAVKGWQLRWDIAKLTLPALVHHWAEIREGKSSEQVQTAIRSRQHADAARTAATRRAEQRDEFQRLYNDTLGLPADTPLPAGLYDPAGEPDPRDGR